MKYKYDLSAFYAENDVSYYLLGAFITDGNVSLRKGKPNAKSCSIASKDKNWLELIRDLICKDLPIRYNNRCYVLDIYSTELGDWFISKGCVPNKSLIVKMPTVPMVYLPDFIRGCMDGDGSISFCNFKITKKNKEYCYRRAISYICSSSKDFIYSLHETFKNLNYKHSLVLIKPKDGCINGKIVRGLNHHYRLSFGGTNAYNFLKWIYYPNHKLSMLRKHNKFIEINNNYI